MSLPRSVIEGKFEVLHKISEGGMGAVYKVRHLLLDQAFVIKVIRSQDQGDQHLLERFHREARAAIRLRHANIAEIHDFSIGEEGTAYIVMEFIDGATLKQILSRQGPPALGLTMEIAAQSLEALSFLHRRGYLHRDVSPDNLMLTSSLDGEPLIKLIDLGLTKRLEGSAELTSKGMFLGKVRYSAPEQFQGRELDQLSDLYSFGVMLYELLTGHCPIQGEGFSELIGAHLLRPPLDFAVTDPRGLVPPGLRRVVMQTLEKDPAKRVATAGELARLLAPFRRPGEAGSGELSKTVALAPGALPAVPATAQTPPRAGEQVEALGGKTEKIGALATQGRSREASVARVEAHLASHELKEATEALAEAEREHGADENFQQLRGQLEDLQRKEREERLKALLEKARRQIALDELTAALESLQEAEEIDSENVSVQALLMQIRTAVDRARANPDRPRWIWGIAATAALIVAAVFGWYTLKPPLTPAERSYQLGVEGLAAGDLDTARQHLKEAIDADPVEKAEGPYLPRYLLGVVHFKTDTCPLALDQWNVSENQGAIHKTPEHRKLLDYRKQCWDRHRGSIDNLRTAIAFAKEMATYLEEILADPGMTRHWLESPELKPSIRRASRDLHQAEERFAAAEARKDFLELLELEEPVADLQTDLERLMSRVAGEE